MNLRTQFTFVRCASLPTPPTTISYPNNPPFLAVCRKTQIFAETLAKLAKRTASARAFGFYPRVRPRWGYKLLMKTRPKPTEACMYVWVCVWRRSRREHVIRFKGRCADTCMKTDTQKNRVRVCVYNTDVYAQAKKPNRSSCMFVFCMSYILCVCISIVNRAHTTEMYMLSVMLDV